MHLLLLLACDTSADKTGTDDSTSPQDSADTASSDTASPDTASPDNACTSAWDQLSEVYPDAGEVGACGDSAAALKQSLLDLSGVVIDAGQGSEGHPCLQLRCDDTYAYIATNALPHWDWSSLTVRELDEDDQYIHRLPLSPTGPSDEGATDIDTLDGCVDAYNQLVLAPTTGTTTEPSGFCGTTASGALTEDGEVYAQLSCTGAIGLSVGGPPAFGPNEAADPDPWGSPLFYYPEFYSSSYGGDGPALDACGFHGHQHALNEACFEAEERVPDTDYAAIWEAWDLASLITPSCEEESGIIGWAYDGYPIQGPCVCVDRAEDGSCADVRRAQTAWVYAGLSRWGQEDGAEEDADGVLDAEGQSCAADSDCCADPDSDSCRMVCALETFASDTGPVVDRRCVVRDYGWCTHEVQALPEPDEAVTLDRCNGYEGPDGYAYRATFSFPYILGCFRGQPSDSFGQGYVLQGSNTGGGGAGGGGGGGP